MAMTNIFEQYGDCVIFWNTDVQTVEVGEIEPLPKAITLNELAEALEEKLYPKFKERYDREMIGAKKAQPDKFKSHKPKRDDDDHNSMTDMITSF